MSIGFFLGNSMITWALAGAAVAHVVWAMGVVAGRAVSAGKKTTDGLKKEAGPLIRGVLGRLGALAAVWLLLVATDVFSIAGHFAKSLTVGLAILVSVGYLDLLPRPRVVPLSWSVIYGGFFGALYYVGGFQAVVSSETLTLELMKLTVQSTAVMGTVLGVCMTILWQMAPTHLQGLELIDDTKVDYHQVNAYRGFSALYMLVLFVFMFVAICGGLLHPLAQTLGIG